MTDQDEAGDPANVQSLSQSPKSFSKNLQYLNLVIHQAHNFHLLHDNSLLVDLEQVKRMRARFNETSDEGQLSEGKAVCRYPDNSSCVNYGTFVNYGTLIQEKLWNRPVEHAKFTSGSPGLISSLNQCYFEAGLKECTNHSCLAHKKVMETTVAHCEPWELEYREFRSKAITAMSCQLALCPNPIDDRIKNDADFTGICDDFVESKAIVVHTHIANFVAACVEILKFYVPTTEKQRSPESNENKTLPLSISNIIHWMANIQYEKGIGLVGFGSWTSKILITPSAKQQVWKACTKAQNLNICEHRVWSLIQVSDRKEADVPDIIDALTYFQQQSQDTDMRWLHDRKCCRKTVDEENKCPSHTLHSKECCVQLHTAKEECTFRQHTYCSSSKCQTSTMDHGSVNEWHMHLDGSVCKWQEAHEAPKKWDKRKKMASQPLEQSLREAWGYVKNRMSDTIRQDVRKFKESLQAESPGVAAERAWRKSIHDKWTYKTSDAVERGFPTAWVFPDADLGPPKDLAAEGASYVALSHVWSDGTGTATPCMLQFFRRMTEKIDSNCNAIWWDAISVPRNEKRAKALKSMHDNYRKAQCTIIHDKQLLLYPWVKKEDLCLALVLSTWFTRSWTALELAVSTRVKVLVRNRDDSTSPMVMDLDDEILAFGPECVSRAHWIARAWIRRLREPVDEMGDVSAILSRRTSSFTRDQSVVAALLANVPDLQTNASEAEIVQKTLQYLGKVPYAGLMHGQPTMTDSKGFSWSPCAVADMQIGLPADIESRAASDYFGMLDVFQGGYVRGEWQMEYVSKDIVEDIQNTSMNILLRLRVESALGEPSKCLLLRPSSSSESDRKALLVGVVGVSIEQGHVECCYIGLVSCNPSITLGFKEARHFIIGRKPGGDGLLDARQAIESSIPKSHADDHEPTRSFNWKPGTNLDDFKLAIQKTSEPAMRHLLGNSGWETRRDTRNNKELFTRPERRSDIQEINEIYGFIKLGLLFLQKKAKDALAYAQNAYHSASELFDTLPRHDVLNAAVLHREQMLVKAHIANFRGHINYQLMTTDDGYDAIRPFKHVLQLQKEFGRSSQNPNQRVQEVAYLEGFGLNKSQYETSQWKKLQLDSLIHLSLLHLTMRQYEDAADEFFEAIRHFTKGESGEDAKVQGKYKDILRMALKDPNVQDQQSISADEILDFVSIAHRALAAFETVFRRDHLLIELTRFYIARAYRLMESVPDESIPAMWVDTQKKNYLRSAKEGLEVRSVSMPESVWERIKESLTELS